MAKTEITLVQAKRIAGKVGARIKNDPQAIGYEVIITGRAFKDLNGNERRMNFFCQTPLEAAHTAVIETGKYCHALLDLCKMTYVNEDTLFRHWGEVEEPKNG